MFTHQADLGPGYEVGWELEDANVATCRRKGPTHHSNAVDWETLGDSFKLSLLVHRANGTTEVVMNERDTMAGSTVPNDRKGVGQIDSSKTCVRQQSGLQELGDWQRG